MSGMERLSGQQATFIYTETPATPFEIGVCLVLGTSEEASGEEHLGRLRGQVLARLPAVPRMRQRVARLPGDLHHPVWVDDDRFDIEHHVRHHAVPSPGSRKQLTTLLDRLLSRPLDHTRALWEVHLIEGLAGGRTALFIKTHHAVSEGRLALDLLATLVDTGPDPDSTSDSTSNSALEPWQPQSRPGNVRLLLGAGADTLRHSLTLPVGMARFGRDVASSVLTSRPATGVRGRQSIPQSRFNKRLTNRRHLRLFDLDLAEVLAVKRSASVSVNDVALCVVGGGVRRYLERVGDPTERSLVAYLPVMEPSRGEGSLPKVKVVTARVGSDDPHPVTRLHRIADRTRRATEQAPSSPPLMLDIAALMGPAIGSRLERLAQVFRASGMARPAGNLVVSNMARIAPALFALGAPVEQVYPFSPITDGVGLNFSLLGYGDAMAFSLMTDPSIVDDPETLVEDCLAEWEDLRSQVLS